MSHRIVIVGGGAAGWTRHPSRPHLGKRGKAQVTLVDANLPHIWKPLLHEVAAGSLNSSEDELNYVAQTKWNHFNSSSAACRAWIAPSRSAWPHWWTSGVELVPGATSPTTPW